MLDIFGMWCEKYSCSARYIRCVTVKRLSKESAITLVLSKCKQLIRDAGKDIDDRGRGGKVVHLVLT